MDVTRIAIVVLALAFVATPALAHVPAFPGDNTSPERALVVPDAAKSWSFYDRLERGQAKYYRLTLEDGQRLRFGAFTPSSDEFTPSVVLMSESVTRTDRVPSGVSVPEGMGTVVFEGERPDAATYEPFTPSANYHTVSVDRTVEEDGVYLMAIYAPGDASGPVGVTIGYEEEFSPTEYLTVPFDLVRIHLWEGQHPLVVAGPWLVTLLGGAALLRVRRRDDRARSIIRYGLIGAGSLILGTGLSALVQIGIALFSVGLTAGMLVTAIFIVVPAVCGAWVLRCALRDDLVLGFRTRSGLAVAGAVSLVTWAGFIVGPAVLLLATVVPTRWIEPSRDPKR
ncbi:hypothetical protein SAMN04487948_111115 [Halogranum amylolyticum]|uniref:Uncharacterized protein n=1 Tax=Halogranum amylolyticum TaxID=660520 RepID=A0A1H8ULN3_9EURY|nr:hypothetical protein [Halogranum amylolyticum]SEP03784.1 hypothetical protein SAMN04487948_111115 [Halogranum amylolyticum]